MCEFWPAEKAHLYCIIVVTANPRHVFLFKITWQLTVFEKTLNAPHHTTQKLGVQQLEELADSMGLQARGGRGEHSPPGSFRLCCRYGPHLLIHIAMMNPSCRIVI
jgi:hypothetical protein